MKNIYYTNPDVTTTTTTTAEALEYGETVVTVADSSSFTALDFVLFEAHGHEYDEIVQIASVDSATQITLSTSIQYPHITGITITLLTYDKYAITKSTDGVIYSILDTGDLNYSNKYNRVEYYDDLGRDSYYYGVYFYNSNGLKTGVTITAATDLFTKASHSLVNGDVVAVSSIVTTTGVNVTTPYYVISVAGDDFQLSLKSSGSAIALTSDGTCSIQEWTLQEELNNQDNFSWITLAKFHAETGLNASYSNYAEEGLIFGVEAMRDDLFFQRELQTSEQDVSFDLILDNYVLADFNGDRLIDKNDIVVFEWDASLSLRTYIHHKIVKLFVDNPKVVFNETVPSSGRSLIIQAPVAQVKYEHYKRSYEKINKLYAVNYLLSDKVPDVVKNSILDWTAGGTTVSRNPNATQEIMEKNNKEIEMLMKDLMLKMYFAKTKLRSQVSSLNIRSRGGYTGRTIMTQSGNVYHY